MDSLVSNAPLGYHTKAFGWVSPNFATEDDTAIINNGMNTYISNIEITNETVNIGYNTNTNVITIGTDEPDTTTIINNQYLTVNSETVFNNPITINSYVVADELKGPDIYFNRAFKYDGSTGPWEMKADMSFDNGMILKVDEVHLDNVYERTEDHQIDIHSDVHLMGNLIQNGDRTLINSEKLFIKDSHLLLNSGYFGSTGTASSILGNRSTGPAYEIAGYFDDPIPWGFTMTEDMDAHFIGGDFIQVWSESDTNFIVNHGVYQVYYTAGVLMYTNPNAGIKPFLKQSMVGNSVSGSMLPATHYLAKVDLQGFYFPADGSGPKLIHGDNVSTMLEKKYIL